MAFESFVSGRGHNICEGPCELRPWIKWPLLPVAIVLVPAFMVVLVVLAMASFLLLTLPFLLYPVPFATDRSLGVLRANAHAILLGGNLGSCSMVAPSGTTFCGMC
jgi:hypothetical protein